MHAKLVRPYHLKLFFSGKHIHASIISKIDKSCVVSASTNNATFKRILGEYAPKNDERACQEVARELAKKAAKKNVTSLCWDGEHTQKTTRKKFKDKAHHVWQSFGQVAPELRLEHTKREDEVEEEEEKTDKDPLTVKALAKESKIDPDFRRQMWALVSQRQQQEWQWGRKHRNIEETNSPV
ncbi:g4685 [Coccomyxa elongata]